MSKIEVNTVAPQCGTTLTLGESGDTVTLGAGASQSGFGRTGTVDWQTSIKTTTFTATSGEGYFCNTSGGAFTVNLPSSPSVGDIVAVKDYAGTFDTQNLTIGRGGSNMNGSAADSVRNTENESLTLVYADATKGWLAVEEGTGYVGETFIVATGGTITCSGDYKIHTFTGPGTFTVSQTASAPSTNSVDYLVVAGGGGGSNQSPSPGQGGGAGGFRLSNSTCMPAPTTSPLANPTGITATVAAFPITVGGAGGVDTKGSTSTFSTISSAGGGSGFSPQGSGGSGGADNGAGNTPPVSPPQGNPGNTGGNNGGGGGAGAVGGNFSPPNNGGVGGDGSFISPTFGGSNGTPGPVGSTRYFGGGGAGGYPVGRPSGIAGGAGGGGTGAEGAVSAGNGTTNTGCGGGGGGPGGTGSGGSGIVIIRYKFQ